MKEYFYYVGEPTDSKEVVRSLLGTSEIKVFAWRRGFSRYKIARWISGDSEPTLQEIFQIMDCTKPQLMEFLYSLKKDLELKGFEDVWKKREIEREIYYRLPWSEAVAQAVRICNLKAPRGVLIKEIAKKTGLSIIETTTAMRAFEDAEIISKVNGEWVFTSHMMLSTKAPGKDKEFKDIRGYWVGRMRDLLTEGKRRDATFNMNILGHAMFAVNEAQFSNIRAKLLELVADIREIATQKQSPSEGPPTMVVIAAHQLVNLAVVKPKKDKM